MKITKVYTEKYKWPKDKPIQNGKTTFTHNSLNLVCIETDEGITGYGTSYELNFVDRLGQLLIGENPLNNEKLWKPSGISAPKPPAFRSTSFWAVRVKAFLTTSPAATTLRARASWNCSMRWRNTSPGVPRLLR